MDFRKLRNVIGIGVLLGCCLTGCTRLNPAFGLEFETEGGEGEGDGDGDGDGDEAGDGDGDGDGVAACPDESPAICEPALAGQYTGSGCDPYSQNCGPGEKCLPIPGDYPVCAPLDPQNKTLGEGCWHFGDQDECGIGLVCDAPYPNAQGVCREICGCGPTYPTCDADDGTVCAQVLGVTYPLCVPSCDPLGNDCGGGRQCAAYPSGYACIPSIGQGAGQGEPCFGSVDCAVGYSCVADGDGSNLFCAKNCEVGDPNACGALECFPFQEVVSSCYPEVGVCA